MDKKGRMLLMSTLGAAMIATAPSQVKADDAKVADANVLVNKTEVVAQADVDTLQSEETPSLEAQNDDVQAESVLDENVQNDDVQSEDTQSDNTQRQDTEDNSASVNKNENENAQDVTTQAESVQNDSVQSENSFSEELAKASTKGWSDDGNGNIRYYIDDDGNYVSGTTHEIDGKWYYFDWDGYLQKNTKVQVWDSSTAPNGEEGYFYASEDGSLVISAWVEDNGNKYYCTKTGKIAENCVEKIGNAYYGFDSSGIMYSDTTFYISGYDQDNNYYNKYYRAKANGILYVNEWYTYEDTNRKFYYGSEGVGASGIVTVGGKTCYFDYDGEMLTSGTHPVDGKYYISKSDGSAVEAKNNEWTKVDGNYYYVKDNVILENRVEKIGNAYYGFDSSGIMYSDTTFSISGYDEDDNYFNKCYRAKASGALYVNEWYTDENSYSNDRYYYGNEGVAASGIVTISGKTYYFYDNGFLKTYGINPVDGKYYISKSDGSVVEAKNNDWTKVDGKYYYVKDNVVLENCVEKIGNAYYGFNYSGIMYSDITFSIDGYDEDDNYFNKCYRAKASGALYVNEWYTDENSYSNDRYYYGNEGVAASGIVTISGKTYYFYDNGFLKTYGINPVDGKYYISKSDGSVVEAKNNDWTKVDGKYYYVKDNVVLENCVEKIGNAYYGFDSSGIMRDDTQFDIYNSDLSKWVYYRAKKGGPLYVNEWYTNENSSSDDKYYYGNEGVAASGIVTISGKTYYFDDNGFLRTSGTYPVDGKIYISKSDGSVVEAKNNNWTNVDGKYYYVKDNVVLRDRVEKIGNAYYGFDNSGIMYDDTYFDIYNSDLGRQVYYRAKKGGYLYVNEWYTDEDANSKFYYGNEGVAASGIVTISGKTYYFYDNGFLNTYGIHSVDGKNYISKSDGSVVEAKNNNWTYVDGKYYYVKDNVVLENCVEKIGNVYFGFNYSGIMYDDTQFDIYNSDLGKSVYYRAKKGGYLYVNEWYTDENSNNKYYYGNEGVAASGIVTISGKTYYFEWNGRLVTSQSIDIDGISYVADKNGVIQTKANGWLLVDKSYYYFQNNCTLKYTVAKINDCYYGFEGTGRMYDNGLFSMGKSNDRYYARKGGSLLTNAWYGQYGYQYYFGADAKGVDGIKTIDGKLCLFDNGVLSKNRAYYDSSVYYIAKNDYSVVKGKRGWNNVDGNYYYATDDGFYHDCIASVGNSLYGFNSDGRMYDNETFTLGTYNYDDPLGNNGRCTYRAKKGGYLYVNSWVEIDGSKYYFGEQGIGYHGLHTIAGKEYNFENGQLKTNCIYSNGELNYVSDNSGIAHKVTGSNKWINYDGIYYYIKDNRLLSGCIVKIDNRYYGFDNDGNMYANQMFYMGYNDTNDQWRNARFYANASGALVTDTWKKENSDWYYFGKDAASVDGLNTINGVTYYFNNGRMSTLYAVSVDDKNYICDKDGAAHEVSGNNKWLNYNDVYFYIKDNGFLRYTVEKIGGAYYGFDNAGKMYADALFNISKAWDGESYENRWFYANESGALTTNKWMTYQNNKYYFGADGASLNGMRTIDGGQYYFEWGKLITNGAYGFGEKNYVSDSKGIVHEIVGNNKWFNIDGKYYYVKNGSFLMNCVEKINGAYYAFRNNGCMYADVIFNMSMDGTYYHAGKSGALSTDGWYINGSEKYYFGSDAKGYEGVHTIDGKQYLFQSGRLIVDGAVTDDGKNYICDKDGNIKVITVNNKWVNQDGIYYYVKDNKFLIDCVEKIGNEFYGFNYKGKMYDNAVFNIHWHDDEGDCHDSSYRAKKGGALYKGTSVTINDVVYYYDTDAKGYEGIHALNGKNYYFERGAVQRSMAVSYDGKNYICGSDGTLTPVTKVTGWIQNGDNWYYILNSAFLKGSVAKIGNAMYGFNYNGHMYKDTTFSAYDDSVGYSGDYKAKVNGTLYLNEWFYQRDGHATYYGADAKAANGILTVNGNKRYFRNGVMVRNQAFTVDGANYVADRNGNLSQLKATGWTAVGEYYYYTKNNVILMNQIAQIGSTYYGFDSWGRMYADTIFSISNYNNGVYTNVSYSADKNGSLKTNTWDESWYSRYFFDEKGSGVTGIKTINNVKYYFAHGRLLSEGAVTVDGVNYGVRSDGSVIQLGNNKWTQVDGKWYYVKNGEVLSGCKAKIGNVTYLFTSNGELANDEVVWDYETEKSYKADKDGKICSNLWVKTEHSYMYFGNDGRLSDGKYTIGGKQYYFNDNGYLMYGVIDIDDVLYVTDNGGALSKLNKTGWILVNNEYYYVSGNKLFTGGVYKIGGSYYGFDWSGKMYNNALFSIYKDGHSDTYYASNGGALVMNKNVTVKGSKYYFDANGKGYEGYHTIGGKEYYFVAGKLMTNYAFCLNGNYYALDANGQKQTIKNNAWTKVGNKYYYVKDGSICYGGVYKINGSYYAFDYDGYMLENELGYVEEDITVHAGANGALTTGWYQDPQTKSWYYFAKNGYGYEGVHYIGGKKYNFSEGKMI